MEVRTIATGDDIYPRPVDKVGDTVTVRVDVSTLTTDYVDANGYLKPGVPLRMNGGLAVAVSGAGQVAAGVTIEPIRLLGRTDNANLAADTRDVDVALAVYGVLHQLRGEACLGRVYSANELAAIGASKLVLR